MSRLAQLRQRAALPALIFVIASSVYVGTSAKRVTHPLEDNHFVHLANSFLHGRLHQEGPPPGQNDWACFDTVDQDTCPNNRWAFPDPERYRFYVSFPPFPAVVIAPAVALFGTGLYDGLFWAILAGFAPAILYILLRHLRESGRSKRRRRDDLLLVALFAVGSVYYFTAVQGAVWFSAHVVACSLLFLYLLFGIDARRPVLAGLMLGLCFMTRPTTAFLAIFFGIEALRVSRRKVARSSETSEEDEASEDDDRADEDESEETNLNLVAFLRAVDVRAALALIMKFSAPILVIGGIAMWMNQARFADPFEFGHTYLQIRWRPRIERWGLFNYHYFSKNLAVFAASLPWLSSARPFIKISRHGLALWFTTPNLLAVLWPKRVSWTMVALFVAIIPVALMNLMYQNSGWIQFGYRFSLDYLPLVFVAIALSRQRFGKLFWALAIFSIVVNTFGAITFNRAGEFYDGDGSQNVLFQPD